MSQYRLTFLLPDRLAFAVPVGRHQPCLAGCVLDVDRAGLVSIFGLSREQIFAQCRRFMRLVARGHGPLSIAAVLTSPLPPGRDAWQIIVGADVAFAPTGLEVDVGLVPAAATGLRLVERAKA